jgi:hypothetical protein
MPVNVAWHHRRLAHRRGESDMTSNDTQFVKEVGIEPCDLNIPFPSSLPPMLPRPPIPTWTKKDARWLLNLRVMWEPGPEPGFWL